MKKNDERERENNDKEKGRIEKGKSEEALHSLRFANHHQPTYTYKY